MIQNLIDAEPVVPLPELDKRKEEVSPAKVSIGSDEGKTMNIEVS